MSQTNWDEAITKPQPVIPIRYRMGQRDTWRCVEFTSVYDRNVCFKFPEDLDESIRTALNRIDIFLDMDKVTSFRNDYEQSERASIPRYTVTGYDADNMPIFFQSFNKQSFTMQLTL